MMTTINRTQCFGIIFGLGGVRSKQQAKSMVSGRLPKGKVQGVRYCLWNKFYELLLLRFAVMRKRRDYTSKSPRIICGFYLGCISWSNQMNQKTASCMKSLWVLMNPYLHETMSTRHDPYTEVPVLVEKRMITRNRSACKWTVVLHSGLTAGGSGHRL